MEDIKQIELGAGPVELTPWHALVLLSLVALLTGALWSTAALARLCRRRGQRDL